VSDTTRTALTKALDFALFTMEEETSRPSSDRIHKIMVATAGAGGGAFGLPALALELPVSVTVMLRSIADVARSEGEQIKLPETKLACVQVFAFGGAAKGDNATETGYYFVRATMSRSISEATKQITQKGLAREGAPAIINFLNQVAAKFGVNVSEKFAAQSLPVIGAIGGALINTVFIDHFQDMARGHFIVRRLERTYGSDLVMKEYENL